MSKSDQEDVQAMGGDTLALLETYVESCDVVVHFIGDMSGSTPKPSSVDNLLNRRPELAARLAEKGMDRAALGRLAYTQWEAWLAVGFNKDGTKMRTALLGAKGAPIALCGLGGIGKTRLAIEYAWSREAVLY
jgi:hypothetical protein